MSDNNIPKDLIQILPPSVLLIKVKQWFFILATRPRVQISAPEFSFRKILDVEELIDRSTLLRVRADSAKSLIVDINHSVLASGKLALQKKKEKFV